MSNHKTMGNILSSAMREEAVFFTGIDTGKLLTQGANMLETFERMANENMAELILLRAERKKHKEFWSEVLSLLPEVNGNEDMELIQSIAHQALDLDKMLNK